MARGAAAAVIVLAALVFIALLVLNLRNAHFYLGSVGDALYHFGLPALLAATVLAFLFLPAAWRAAAAISLATVVPALYGAELYLSLTLDSQLARAAAARGSAYDARSKLELIGDLRRGGVAAYPSTRAKDLLVDGPDGGSLHTPISVAGEALLPLANVPGRMIVSCNETGRWLVYRSDRHGFRNADEAWRRPGVALIGDSFVHGDCVDQTATIAGQLGSGERQVLNLGTAGFGPLSMLASLKEYLPALAPPVVVWFFFEGNDLTKDLTRERRSALMKRYLQPGFSQNLAQRPGEITDFLAAYLDANLKDAMARVDHPAEALLDFLKLYLVRERFGLDPVSLGVVDGVSDADFDLFRQIVAEAQRTVAGWGGRLYFVYLPDSTRYLANAQNSRIRDHIRSRVLALVRGLSIPVIDGDAAFRASGDPMALFHYPGSHYNEAGYRTVARAVNQALGPPQR